MLLRNAHLVLPDHTIESRSLLIDGGRIARILASSDNVTSDRVIDLDGCTLFPGFIDIHIHGAAGVDTMEATDDGLHRIALFLRNHGVTAWLPTLVPAGIEEYKHATEAISDVIDDQRSHLPIPEARALGVHYEGPFVNSRQCGALHREHFRTFTTVEDIDSLPTLNDINAIHMMTVAPEVEGGIALIKELTRRNWITSIGHTRATTEVLDQALAAGTRHMTHFMNAMTPLHHRAPGPIDWGLMNDEVTCDVIADGIHLDRSILKLVLRNKTSRRVSLISDAIAATGLGDGEYQIWGETIAVKNGRTQNATGSIAGSVITMLDAAQTMLALGFSASEVAQMSSLNPARLLRIDKDYGSIEVGKRADLVALDNKQKVRLTIIGGQVAFQDLPS